jgi:ferredoxin
LQWRWSLIVIPSKAVSYGYPISDYVLNHQRVLSTECSLCQTCITVCPQQALKLSFGFDLGGKELLRERSLGKN